MLEKPDIPDEGIHAFLLNEYSLSATQISFLPLGADINSAVYRVITNKGSPFFLKLRKGTFESTSVELPKFLCDQGIAQVIPPIETVTGQLWGSFCEYKTILYPYIEGQDGYKANMSEEHWQQLGIALKQIHTTSVPGRLYNSLRRENYPAAGRETVMVYLARVKDEVFDDPVASQLAAFLNIKRTEILDLVGRAARLSRELQAQQPEMVICHSDIHAGNILMGDDGALYIVDWDEPLLAPKERDLMFIGGGLLASGLTPQGEEALFYPSYGPAHIHASALAYYRYERIVQDIAAYCDQLFLTKAGGEDREEALYYLKSNFFPNGTIEIAYQSDSTGQKMTFDEP